MNKNKKVSDMTIGELEELIKSLLPNIYYYYHYHQHQQQQQYNPMPYVGDGIPPYLSNDKPCKWTDRTEII